MFSFSINVCVTKNWRFTYPDLTLDLLGINPVYVSSSDSRYKLNDEALWCRDDINRVRISFTSHDYEFETDAKIAGEKLQHSLALLGANWRTGIDPEFISMLTPGTYSGVSVGPASQFLSSGYGGGGVTINIDSAKTLENGLNKFISQAPLTSERLRAAAILANQEFSGGLKCSLDDGLGRLVARVSAIEALVECPRRSENVQACIDAMLKQVNEFSGLTENERQKLKNGVGMLRNESISASCKQMINETIKTDESSQWIDKPAKQFGLAYNYRSGFLHAGKHSEEKVVDLDSHDAVRSVGIDLDTLIQHLLVEDNE